MGDLLEKSDIIYDIRSQQQGEACPAARSGQLLAGVLKYIYMRGELKSKNRSREEVSMKLLRCALFLFLVWAAAYPQTKELGQGVYYNGTRDIMFAVDVTVAVRKIDSPYVMFMAFMAAKENKSLSVKRDDVTMIYKGQEYHMPTLKDIEKAYKGEKEDAGLYRRFGKELLLFGELRYYRFPYENEFFPTPGFGPTVWVNEASLVNLIGFKTKLYFKNPGFQPGDEVTFRVFDRKHPESKGEVTVVLK
jgi:hypothetical protein